MNSVVLFIAGLVLMAACLVMVIFSRTKASLFAAIIIFLIGMALMAFSSVAMTVRP